MIARLAHLGATVALAAITLLVTSSAIMRYFVNAPFRFTEELVGLLLATMLFLSLPLGVDKRLHVRVSLLSDRLTGWPAKIVQIFASFVVLGFSLVFAWDSIHWLGFAIRRNIRSEAAEILLWPWMALVPIAFGLVAWLAVRDLRNTLRNARGR